MAPQGYSDGGVYFSTKNPLSYEPELSSYATRLHHDGFGPENVAPGASEDTGNWSPSHHVSAASVDMCVVYAIHPEALHAVPDRPDVWIVPRSAFQSFSVVAPDGAYYLRADRTFAMICFNPGAPELACTTLDESEAACLKDVLKADDETRQQLVTVRSAQNKRRTFNATDYKARPGHPRHTQSSHQGAEAEGIEQGQQAWWRSADQRSLASEGSDGVLLGPGRGRWPGFDCRAARPLLALARGR